VNAVEVAGATMERVVADLRELAAIPSVALPGFPTEPVERAARATAAILADAGWRDVELVDVPDGPPAVFAHAAGADGGGPTVLLYAHYDVMPAGPEDAWSTPPWTPTERDGRLYGRGTADNKCGIAMHAGVLRAFDGRPPVNLKVLVEGAEEAADGSLERLLEREPERFAADVVVLADCGNRRTGEPTLTTALRGLAAVDVEVATLERPAHSGLYGGPLPDAALVLARLLASLHDDDGNVAVAGLRHGAWEGHPVDEHAFLDAAGVLDGVHLIGDGSLAERLFTRPAINAIGIDVPPVDGATNALVPRARARVSARLAPEDDPHEAAAHLVAHLRRVAPWGAHVDVRVQQTARGVRLPSDSRVERAALAAMTAAYGSPAIAIGCGGGLPLLPALCAAYPEMAPVLWGAYDDRSQVHAANESVDLGELRRALHAQALLLASL